MDSEGGLDCTDMWIIQAIFQTEHLISYGPRQVKMCHHAFTKPGDANSVDPDQLASEEATWSGSTLFVSCTCTKSHTGISSISTETFYSIHWFCLWTAKALIRLHGCAGWAGPLLSAYTLRHILARHDPSIKRLSTQEDYESKYSR